MNILNAFKINYSTRTDWNWTISQIPSHDNVTIFQSCYMWEVLSCDTFFRDEVFKITYKAVN